MSDLIKQGNQKISPQEIETLLMNHESVEQAAVFGVPHQRLGQVAVAAVVFKEDKKASESDLKSFALDRLEEYKAPRHVVFAYELPKEEDGSLLREKLHEQLSELITPGFVPPETETESRLAAIWAEMLEVEQVGRFDNFFIKGGDSSLAEQTLSRINKDLNTKLTQRQFFLNPSPSELGYIIDKSRPKANTAEFGELLSEIDSLSEDDLLKHLE